MGAGACALLGGRRRRPRAALRQARDLAAAGGDHWAEFECSARLAMLEVETGAVGTAVQLASELGPLALSLGPGGSEGAFAAAVLGLARLAAGEPGAADDVDDAVVHLDQIDARYLMPEVLNVSAQMEYTRGDLARAQAQAERALALALSVDRPLEAGRAHAVLACVAAGGGSPEDAVGHIDAAREAGSDQLSARAGAWLQDAERMPAPQGG